MKINYLLLFLSICLSTLSFGQSNKIKFGKVSMDEVNMQHYEYDSSASAIILYERGYYNDKEFKFTRHIRVKILKKTGLSWANWVFNTPSASQFKLLVFNKNGEEMEKTKLDQKSIFKEEIVDGFYVSKVFSPNVKVGSVIDIEYNHSGLPFEWRFQQLIPVVYNELELDDSQFIHFKKASYGFEPINQIKSNKWSVKNMPAFQKEPFLNDYSNYVTKFEFQLSQITVPGRYYKEFSTTWEKVSDNLSKDSRFGAGLKGMSYLKDKAKELKSKDAGTLEKINEAYDFIQQNIKWNGSNSIFLSLGLRSNFVKDHNGNSADVNLSLLSLLTRVGITAYPVVLSTRDNGRLIPYHAALSKLNHVVVCAIVEGERILLDATNEDLTPGILSKNSLNGPGWLIIEDKGEWLDLNPTDKHKRLNYVQIELDNEEGVFKASIRRAQNEFAYLEWVDQFNEYKTEDKYLDNLKNEYPDLEFIEYSVKGNEKEKSKSSEAMIVDMSSYVDDLDGEFLINPNFLSGFSSNIFKSTERKYPVDLAYPIEESNIIIISIPDGFEIEALPPQIKLTGLEGSLSFTYMPVRNGDKININCKIKISKSIFNEAEYHYVRSFFSAISEKFNEPIHIKKL